MNVGKNISWQTLAKGFTHGFVVEFENQEDLDYYHLEDEVHLAFAKKAGPLVEDSCVIGKLPTFGSFPKATLSNGGVDAKEHEEEN